jgi:putative phosphoribosyl transferase
VDEVRAGELDEMERRRKLYRESKPMEIAEGTVILVDDGIATGATTEVALKALRARGVRKIVLSVPVAPPDTIWRMRKLADEVICLLEPVPFVAIGQWYEDFDAVPDAEVKRLLAKAHAHAA